MIRKFVCDLRRGIKRDLADALFLGPSRSFSHWRLASCLSGSSGSQCTAEAAATSRASMYTGPLESVVKFYT